MSSTSEAQRIPVAQIVSERLRTADLRGQPVADGPAFFFTHLGAQVDVDAAARSARGGRVAAIATNARTAQAEALIDFADGAELLRGLHTSSLMPFLGRGPLDFREPRTARQEPHP